MAGQGTAWQAWRGVVWRVEVIREPAQSGIRRSLDAETFGLFFDPPSERSEIEGERRPTLI
jgi:hypothetical protein